MKSADSNLTCLTLGTPRFLEDDVARIARSEGLEAAWRAALARGPRAAAASVHGPFAVGLRDSSGRVFLAVDRFSIRTLCYRVDGGILRFGERADEVAGQDAPIDPQALFNYLYFHNIPSPSTVFEGVYRLPPGHFAVWEGGRLVVEPYWVPEFRPEPVSFMAAQKQFLSLLEQAVARQLNQGSRPACFLSGGTDSSTVAGMIGRANGRPAATYSIGFDAAGYDEMEYARIAAKHFGTEHHEYYITPDDLVRAIPAVASHYDQPFGNSSALPTYYCTLQAGRDGVTQMLAGDGGDELFGGNARYAKQRVFGLYSSIPQPMRKGLLEPLLERTLLGELPGVKKARSYVSQAKIRLPARMEMYNLLERLGIGEVLTPSFLSLIDRTAPSRLQDTVWTQAKADNEIDRILAYDWRFTLADNDLPKVCGTATLARMQVAFPLLDDELVAFSMGLPPHFKLRRLQLRWFFKEALRGFLPDAIISKKKHGFGLPFGPWAVTHTGLRALATESVTALASRGIVRQSFAKTLLEERLPEHPGYFGELIWVLVMLEQWLRHHRPRTHFA